VRKIKTLMEAGELGEIYSVNISRVNLGIFQKDANVVWDLAPHDVAMLNYLFGADPVSVSAIGHCYVQKELGIEDVAFVTLEYPGGRLVHIHVSWLDPNKIRLCTFVGSRKMLVYDDVSPSEKIRVYDKGVDRAGQVVSYGDALTVRSGDILIPRLSLQEPLTLECRHFVECVRDRRPPLTDGASGLRVVRVLAAAQASLARGGQPVRLADAGQEAP
jgi:predicted dehydrogenase